MNDKVDLLPGLKDEDSCPRGYRLVAIDTETTSLRADRRAWDIGLIVREPGHADREHQWFVHAADLDLGNADPMALRIGRFHKRHPAYVTGAHCISEKAVLRQVEEHTRGAHLVGAVVSFDAEVLAARMRANGICPSWHYHLIDVEALAVGYLHGRRHGESADREWSNAIADIGMPWNSKELSRAVGVNPDQFDAHCALEDAKWALAIYDAVTRGTRSTRPEPPPYRPDHDLVGCIETDQYTPKGGAS